MLPPLGQVPDLVARVAAGDREAIAGLLARYHARLRRMVALRLDPRVQGRVDASDVIQEGYLDAVRRLEEHVRDPSVSFFIGLRFLRTDPIDREVLARRHFEQLGRAETAQVSGITQEAAATRYIRALNRLKDVLATLPGGWEGF
jgi:RNA polymerase sigma-70 factor (ECF subfamily)